MLLLLAKIGYAFASPLSVDFIAYVELGRLVAEHGSRFLGIYTISSHLYALAYGLWQLLPIDHPEPTTLLTFQILPNHTARVYFNSDASGWVFAAVMKLPILLLDILTTCMIYVAVRKLTGSRTNGLLGAILWQANPFIAVLEITTTVDTAVALFFALMVHIGSLGKAKWTALVTFLGGVYRLAPFLAVPSCFIYFAKIDIRKGMGFLVVLTISIAGIFGALLGFMGTSAISELTAHAAAYAEVRGFLGPLLEPRAKAVASAVGLNLVFYLGFIWWYAISKSRELSFGVYGPLLFYMAFSLIYPAFMLWIAPYLIQRVFGPEKDWLSFASYSIVGFIWLIIDAPGYLSGFGTGLFFVPAWNEASRNLAIFLTSLQGTIEYPRQITRSMLAAVFIHALIRTIRSQSRLENPSASIAKSGSG